MLIMVAMVFSIKVSRSGILFSSSDQLRKKYNASIVLQKLKQRRILIMILEEADIPFNFFSIQKPGLGTWFINDKDVLQAVKDEAEIGCRHIDTAQAYNNKNGVGQRLRACGVERDEFRDY